jgi:hypothetical protein
MKATGRFGLASVPLALTAVGLAACASLFGGNDVKVRPIDNMSSLTTMPRDTFYESAVSAINEKDYARALDYLQEARARDPRNVKALNALGVVYDKLGRFDLSARYYAQARAVDPDSRIVTANIGYSKVLQGLGGDQRSVASLDTAGAKPLLTEKPPVMVSSLEAGTVHVAPVEKLPVSAAGPVAAAFAPPTPSPVVAVSIPAEIVAPIIPAADKKIAVLPAIPAPIAPAIRPAQISAESLSIPSVVANPVAEVKTAGTLIQPAVIAPVLPVAAERPAVSPILPGTMVPVVHPVEKQIAVLSNPVFLIKPAIERRTAAAPNPPTVATPVAERQTGPRPAFSPPIARIDRVAEKRDIAPSAPALAKPVKTVREARIVVPVVFHAAAAHAVAAKVAEPLPGNRKVLTIGKPVKILNASGRHGGTGLVSRRLAVLGWTVRQSDWRIQPATTLYFPAQNIVAAKAMQRTLPFPVRLTADSSTASAMRLVIGRDYLSWKPRNARLAALWQNGPVVASLQKPSIRGAR